MKKMNYKYIVTYKENNSYKTKIFKDLDSADRFIWWDVLDDELKQFVSLVTIPKKEDNVHKEALKILKKKADLSVALQYGNGTQTFKKGTNQKCQITYADWDECINCYVDITEDEYEILDEALKDLEDEEQ